MNGLGLSDRRQQLLIGAVSALLLGLLLAAAWRWTPLSEWAQPSHVAGQIRAWAQSPWMPLFIAVLYLAGNSVLFPNTVLNGAIILALGTGWGVAYALGGSLFAGSVHYALGRRYGEQRLQELDIDQLDRIIDKLQQSGVIGMVVVRMLPIAPYAVVNLMVGAAGISFGVFFVGTLIGLLPGSLAVTALGHQLERLISNPSPQEVMLLAALALVCAAALRGLHAWAQRWMN